MADGGWQMADVGQSRVHQRADAKAPPPRQKEQG